MSERFTCGQTRRLLLITLCARIGLLVLSYLATPPVKTSTLVVLLQFLVPTCLVALWVIVPWPARLLGQKAALAIGLTLDVLAVSLQTAPVFFNSVRFWPLPPGVSSSQFRELLNGVLVEPLVFLLIPLLLFAWAYGQRGALLGSTWAAALHMGGTLLEVFSGGQRSLLSARDISRIVILYVSPLVVAYLARRERQHLAEIEQAHADLRHHAATVEQLAVSRERNRLARHLHDTLAHSLAALTVQLKALRVLLAHDPAAAGPALDEAIALSQSGLQESRQAIQELRADPLTTLGLQTAIKNTVQAFQARTGIPVDLRVTGQELDLTAEQAQTLYRVADEALTNVERHAHAQQVRLDLAFGAQGVSLTVRDDGIGFNPAQVPTTCYGLTGMQERAAMVKANLQVQSRPGAGTLVTCSLKR